MTGIEELSNEPSVVEEYVVLQDVERGAGNCHKSQLDFRHPNAFIWSEI